MFARLKASLAKFKPFKKKGDLLPSTIDTALQSGLATELEFAMSVEFAKEFDSVILQRVYQRIEELHWEENQRIKFLCWASFHSGRLFEAYRLAFDFLQSENKFDTDIYMHGCLSAYHANRFEDAYEIFLLGEALWQMLESKWDFLLIGALINWSVGKHLVAMDFIQKAESLRPDDFVTLGNLLNISFECGFLDTYQAIYQRLTSSTDSTPETTFALAYCDLAEGRYQQGFSKMESRYGMREMHKHLSASLLAMERCKKFDDFENKRILITAEQGLGDTVMLSRYFHLLAGKGDFALECQSEVLPLIAHNFPWLKIVELNHGASKIDFDSWVATMSLPHFFNTDIDSVPGKAGYLEIPPDSMVYWKQRVAECVSANKLKVGITWSGSPTHRADRRRSIPFDLFKKYLSKVDADYFVLQTVVPADLPTYCINLSDEMLSLADTAALIKQLDVVVTIDTSVVHVAGAIGHNTILLLPRRYEWRWQLEGPGNPWYDSVEVVRQQENGVWEAVLEEVFSNKLPALLNRKREVKNV